VDDLYERLNHVKYQDGNLCVNGLRNFIATLQLFSGFNSTRFERPRDVGLLWCKMKLYAIASCCAVVIGSHL
jgi:hypothetical protein